MLIKKITLRVIISLSIFLIVACNQNSGDRNEISSDDTAIIQKRTTENLTIDSTKQTTSILPETFFFKFSECIENCNDNERIISLKEKGDSLFLKFGTIQNCIGKFRPEIKSHNDTLEINIKINGEIIKRKNGRIDTIMVTNECDCYFYFEIGITNLLTGHKTILLDGHKIGTKPSKYIIEPEFVLPTPEFIGGADSLIKYLKRNINYPNWEKENGIQGKVYVTFTVDKDGKVKNPKILRSVNGAKNFDAEALRVVSNMPKWKPSEIRNVKVDAEFYLPIEFKL
jgi:TonB family protein